MYLNTQEQKSYDVISLGPSVDLTGPTKYRECRDVVFLLVFLTVIAGMVCTACRDFGNLYVFK